MRRVEGDIRLSATDLSNHIACAHLTQLELGVVHGEAQPPFRHDPRVEALQQRGLEHERRYVKHLAASGRSIHEVPDTADPQRAFEGTIEAMRSGMDVIVQATLASGRWLGRADVLLRVDTPSNLGNWSYEPADTKLSRETKAGTVLQLCTYGEIVGGIQGRLPELMHVVTPGSDFVPETYRTQEYFAYYRHVKVAVEHAVGSFQPGGKTSYPDPVPHCDVCRWWAVCDQRRRNDDHLSLVAGISRVQRKELQARGVGTLEALGQLPLPLQWKPSKGSPEGYEKTREQARIQLQSRQTGRRQYELLTVESGRGLCRLPAPSAGDLFFDFEGDPFVDGGGLEFLWGWVALVDDKDSYEYRWSLNRTEERAAFEDFIDMVMARWKQYPDLHIYHYAPYEPAALKRLMGRYASRETEIDQMLRAGLFVDLYGIVRQSLRAGVEHYSIKDLEVFFSYDRAIALPDASDALRRVECAIELDNTASIAAEDRESVRAYNADDCRATRHLRDWLEGLREERIAAGDAISRPAQVPGEAPETVTAWLAAIGPVRERLLQGLPLESSERSPAQQSQWLLAQMLEFHRREAKAPWWEFFRLAQLGPDELMDERSAISGLHFIERVGGKDKNPIHRYTFPFQEVAISPGDAVQISEDEAIGTVETIDLGEGWVEIKKRKDACDKHPVAVFSKEIFNTKEMEKAILRIATAVMENSIDGAGPYRSGRDLLLRRAPRLQSGEVIRRAGEDTLAAARRVVSLLDQTSLCIQGPPGTGKTYTAARMAIDLAKQGKTVGVCAQSHKVIRNLLKAIVNAATEEGLNLPCIHRINEPLGDDSPNIAEMKDNDDARAALLRGEVRVVGGTAWLWSREEFAQAVDVLFLDEAGQYPLANAIAISQGASSLVLVGDPQQLESPLQGAHPEGTDVSALHHVLAGRKTMPDDLGLFIPDTRRLAPNICNFTSEQFYESRLVPFAGMERQAIHGHAVIEGAGLWFAPAPHEGNRNYSREEVQRVREIVGALLRDGVTWTNPEGRTQPLRASDILIVSPYNSQVAELRRAIPGIQIGTVDKFQGQEAPIVLYSMATSSPEDAPRGMEFLYSLNRLNVATSRARCACILVANPGLLEPECRTPGQMRLANAFCRYLELARFL